MIGRREFCIGLAALGGSVAISSCSSPQPTAETNQEILEADIVVLGSGLAGSACALAAAENGAKVLLLEKAPFLGASFQTSKGNVSICQIEDNEEFWQFVSENTDTMNDFLERYKQTTEIGKSDAPYPDYERVQKMMEESCETISWVEKVGVDFVQSFTKEQVGTDTVWPDTSSNPEAVGGMLLVEKLQSALEKAGVEVLLGHEGTELIVEDNVVVGIKAKNGSSAFECRAKAIVLATGGYGASSEYCDEFVPAINEIGFQYLGNGLNTGDGITMSKAVDAALYDDCWVIPYNVLPGRKLSDINSDFLRLCDAPTSGKPIEGGSTANKLMVDASGSRFINEAAPGIALATTMADRKAAPYYILFDSSNKEICSLLESGLNTDSVIKGETIKELAETAGMSELENSFKSYQESAQSGLDEQYEKPADNLVAYSDGPFYLVNYVPSYVTTMGGVQTDSDCHVLRNDGSVVEGLYAIGELTHRFMYNRSFVRHCSNSSGLTMGRLTGSAIASQL